MLDIVRYEPIIFYNITVIHISCLMYLTMGIPNFVSSELYTHTHTHTHTHTKHTHTYIYNSSSLPICI